VDISFITSTDKTYIYLELCVGENTAEAVMLGWSSKD